MIRSPDKVSGQPVHDWDEPDRAPPNAGAGSTGSGT
jgi:hypothetical protein